MSSSIPNPQLYNSTVLLPQGSDIRGSTVQQDTADLVYSRGVFVSVPGHEFYNPVATRPGKVDAIGRPGRRPRLTARLTPQYLSPRLWCELFYQTRLLCKYIQTVRGCVGLETSGVGAHNQVQVYLALGPPCT